METEEEKVERREWRKAFGLPEEEPVDDRDEFVKALQPKTKEDEKN